MANELELGSGLKLTNPAPADAYYTQPQDGEDPARPYDSVAQACEVVPAAVRYLGMAVAVLVNGKAVRHTWAAGLANDDLVPDTATVAKPSKRLWLVHNAGQSGGDGSFENPYPTIQAAHNAAGSFDTILVAGGTYSGKVTITKSLTILALGDVTLTGEVEIGAYPQFGTGLTVRLDGVTLANRTVVIRQSGLSANHVVTFDRCVLSGVGYLEHYGVGTDHPGVDTVRINNMRGGFRFAFNEHSSYLQGCEVYVMDCRLNSDDALFSGVANASSHIYLEGFTFLSEPVQVCTRNGANLADADIITDNRLSSGGDGGGGGDGGDAATLNGQNGNYYRARANHTGTQAISTVTGLQAALDELARTYLFIQFPGATQRTVDVVIEKAGQLSESQLSNVSGVSYVRGGQVLALPAAVAVGDVVSVTAISGAGGVQNGFIKLLLA